MTNKEKNTYQKQYRQEKKHCTIIFELEQHGFLNSKAIKAGKPFGTYVREQALANASKEYVLPFDTQTHEVKILLIRHGTNLNQIAFVANAKKDISLEIIQQIQKQFSEMQQGITKIYNAPIEVKE
jgi:hypothetical protein